MWFGVALGLKGENISLGHFLSFWWSSTYESKYFGPDRSVWAENLPETLFLYEESEKNGPESICWPPRFQYGWFLQILTLNQEKVTKLRAAIFNNRCSTWTIFNVKSIILKIKMDFQTWINSKKYFSKLNVILKSQKQNLDLLKYSFLKILAFINVRLFRLKMCPKKVTQ